MAKKSKKRRTAKQKAASRRNIKKAQQKTRTKKRARSRKSNKQRGSMSRSVAKKKSSRRGPGKKSFIDKIPILRNKTVQKVAFGLGMGAIVIDIIQLASRFAPQQISGPLQQNQGLIKLGVELATEPLSAVVDVALNPQQLQGITGRLGGGNGGMTQQAGSNMVGFA